MDEVASAKNTAETTDAIQHFLNHAASNPDRTITDKVSSTILTMNSDAAYLVTPEAQSRAREYHYLTNHNRT